MRFTQAFNLPYTQGTVDFVDIDVHGDVPLFIDPTALRQYSDQWCRESATFLQSFFQELLRVVIAGNESAALDLLRPLREPNEYHLGLSKGKAQGRGLGPDGAKKLYSAMSRSQAVSSGLLKDLEDTVLLIDGVGIDTVSDIASNVIRFKLIEYTSERCEYFGIPTPNQVDSGPLWDPVNSRWFNKFVNLPVIDNKKLILVPKEIVRRHIEYSPEDYYRNFILEKMRQCEIEMKTELVKTLKDGRLTVNKAELEKKYGFTKALLLTETLKDPELLEKFRAAKSRVRRPIDNQDLFGITSDSSDELASASLVMFAVQPGRDEADAFEKTVQSTLTLLFNPDLTRPRSQVEIHDGRKRIDIEFTNFASSGFWRFINEHVACPKIFIECKNYNRDVGNPEVDQLAGRFSRERGQFGLLIGRSFSSKEKILETCRDTCRDGRGFIIPLDDGDLRQLIEEKNSKGTSCEFELLFRRHEFLIS